MEYRGHLQGVTVTLFLWALLFCIMIQGYQCYVVQTNCGPVNSNPMAHPYSDVYASLSIPYAGKLFSKCGIINDESKV